jgi:hypothetical protein
MAAIAKPPFDRAMRDTYFLFPPACTSLNHGSFGAYLRQIQKAQSQFQKLQHVRPDMFIVYDLPYLINTSPAAIAHLLRYEMDEVVFVPNVTTGVNVVLRDLEFGGDVILYFSTIDPACEKTVMSLEEMDIIKGVKIEIEF